MHADKQTDKRTNVPTGTIKNNTSTYTHAHAHTHAHTNTNTTAYKNTLPSNTLSFSNIYTYRHSPTCMQTNRRPKDRQTDGHQKKTHAHAHTHTHTNTNAHKHNLLSYTLPFAHMYTRTDLETHRKKIQQIEGGIVERWG